MGLFTCGYEGETGFCVKLRLWRERAAEAVGRDGWKEEVELW